jgi:hypothetical protein
MTLPNFTEDEIEKMPKEYVVKLCIELQRLAKIQDEIIESKKIMEDVYALGVASYTREMETR